MTAPVESGAASERKGSTMAKGKAKVGAVRVGAKKAGRIAKAGLKGRAAESAAMSSVGGGDR